MVGVGPGAAGAGSTGSGWSTWSRRGRALRLVTLLAVAVVVARLAAPTVLRWLPLPGAGVPPGWAVVLCDVGQGDALVLRTGADRAVLVDTGPAPDAVDRCLRRLAVRHLDLVVITHFHADHAFGLPGALRGRDVGAVWVSPLGEPAANAEAVRRWAGERGVRPVQAWAGAQGSAGRDGWTARWRVLEPWEPPVAASDAGAADGSSVNESSVALVFDLGGPAGRLRLLDLGDLETERQDGLAARLGSGGETLGGPVDVVKVAHHGSSRQSAALYAASGARLGLIGVGAGNDYGHPAAAALSMLARDGIRAARTDLGGDLAIEPCAAGLRLTQTR